MLTQISGKLASRAEKAIRGINLISQATASTTFSASFTRTSPDIGKLATLDSPDPGKITLAVRTTLVGER
jgi:hypothetical protein